MGKAAEQVLDFTPARPKRSLPAEMMAVSAQVNQGSRSEPVWVFFTWANERTVHRHSVLHHVSECAACRRWGEAQLTPGFMSQLGSRCITATPVYRFQALIWSAALTQQSCERIRALCASLTCEYLQTQMIWTGCLMWCRLRKCSDLKNLQWLLIAISSEPWNDLEEFKSMCVLLIRSHV